MDDLDDLDAKLDLLTNKVDKLTHSLVTLVDLLSDEVLDESKFSISFKDRMLRGSGGLPIQPLPPLNGCSSSDYSKQITSISIIDDSFNPVVETISYHNHNQTSLP